MNTRVAIVTLTEAQDVANLSFHHMQYDQYGKADDNNEQKFRRWYVSAATICGMIWPGKALSSHSDHRVPTINFIALCCYLQGYWDGYDPNVNPNVIDAFAAAAFRFGHSLLPTAIERWSKAHKFIGKRNVTWAVQISSWKLPQF